VQPWVPHLVPAVYSKADTLAAREFPPDTLGAAAREPLFVGWTAHPPQVDGRLDDWRLVRWYDLAGARALVQGGWTSDADLSLRFALQADAAGLWFGATLRDDHLANERTPVQERETITLTVASESPVVQHYWMGSVRSVRVRVDGVVDAWTFMRNRRREMFDATALGVQARVQRDSVAGRAEVELFVPWAVLYPLLPRTDSKPLVNVLVDDFDAGTAKRAAWSTQVDTTVRPRWAALEWRNGPAETGWLAVAPGPYAEGGLEWLVVPPAGGVPRGIAVRCAAGTGGREFLALRSKPFAGPAFVRVRDLNLPRGDVPAARRWIASLDFGRDGPVLHSEIRAVPNLDLLRTAFTAAATTAGPDTVTGFPNAADAAVRIQRGARLASGIGAWEERKFHATGITAYRQAAWAAVDAAWDEALFLDAARRGDAAGVAAVARRWPQRRVNGIPTGEVLQRGYVCELDGTVQTYAVYVPARIASPAPLVLALHDLDADERTLFEASALAGVCEQRGVMAVSPGGRGNAGYSLAGERDALDVLAAARRALPVDGKRLAVTGAGLGGTGTWLLVLRHPDLFAAACGVSGYGDLDQNDIFTRLGFQPAERDWFNAHNPVRLLRKGNTTAFRIVHGDHDAVVSPVQARILDDKMNELGITHELQLEPGGDHGMRLFDADLDANLAFLTAHARPAPGTPDASRFAARGGPLCDVFARGPFAIVYGTREPVRRASNADSATAAAIGADSTTAWQLAAEWNQRFGGVPRLIPDRDAGPEILAMNLLLVGTPETNTVLARWAGGLAMRWEDDAVIVGDKAYRYAKYGVAVALPHPEPNRGSIVVCSGLRNRVTDAPRPLYTAAAAVYVVSAAHQVQMLPLE